MSARGRSAETIGDNGDGGVADGGPGLVYMSFVVMEDLLDKLKLLNYEEVNYIITLLEYDQPGYAKPIKPRWALTGGALQSF